MSETVNHPPHYNALPAKCTGCGKRIECIDVVRHLSFNIGNIIKYLWRHDFKNGMEDLKKARWYLDNEINKKTPEQD